MVIVMRTGASPEQIEAVAQRIEQEGLKAHVSQGVDKVVIGVIGRRTPGMLDRMEVMPGVEAVIPIDKPYKFAARAPGGGDTQIRVGNVAIGSSELVIMAGPCTVESEEQIYLTAQAVKQAGAHMLRGGAYKPRTSPYSFQGMGEAGLQLLKSAAKAVDLPVVTEVMEPGTVDKVATYADVLQIGARNMQNYPLLRAVGQTDKPVMLKRGFAATIEEWLLAAEYIMSAGNMRVVLCERGIRTFEPATRNTLDLSAVPLVKKQSHLPVIVDPSHGTGKWYLVKPMSLAAVAAGADGLMIEVHPQPDLALSDGAQSVTPENFMDIMDGIRKVAAAVGRTVPSANVQVQASVS